MKLVINGQEQSFDSNFSLAALIEKLGMKQDRVAVELNREIVRRDLWAETNLSEGDKLEIVHFVGGGNSLFPIHPDRFPANSFTAPKTRAGS